MELYTQILEEIKSYNAELVLVTKTKPAKLINEFYERGHLDFGENKVQELVPKHEELPKNIRWHFIGHLQKNKVKYIAPFVYMIHSVDSIELIEEIEKRAGNSRRDIRVLLEVKIAEEDSKFGLSYQECESIIEKLIKVNYQHVIICGLMGMATYTEDQTIIANEFSSLFNFFKEIKEKYFKGEKIFSELSMGMSGDYKIALKNGATLVRIGSLIVGSR